MAVLPSGRKLLAWKIPGVAWARWPLTTTTTAMQTCTSPATARTSSTATKAMGDAATGGAPLCRCHDHCQRRQFNKAAARYRRALALDSTFAAAYVNLGNIYLREERFDAAQQLFAQALAADSTHANAYNSLGNLHLMRRELCGRRRGVCSRRGVCQRGALGPR